MRLRTAAAVPAGGLFLAAAAGGLQALSVAWPGTGQAHGSLQILSLALLAFGLARLAGSDASARPVLMAAARRSAAFAVAWLAGTFWWLHVSMHQVGGLPAPLSVAAVRLLPALLAAVWAGLCALLWQATGAGSLLGAALLGYLAGALWLWPLLGQRPDPAHEAAAHVGAERPSASQDARSERLKFVHTLSDVLVATLLASHWARLHGAAEAGCLLLLLRLLGFVPALVSSAWAQVVLSRPRAQRPGSWAAVLAATLGLGKLAAALLLALHMGWLPAAWQGLQTYLWPLLLWQLAASAMAALSHRPFRFGQAHRYTGQCLAINAGQALLVLAPPLWGWGLNAQLWALSLWLTLGLGWQALWAARLR